MSSGGNLDRVGAQTQDPSDEFEIHPTETPNHGGSASPSSDYSDCDSVELNISVASDQLLSQRNDLGSNSSPPLESDDDTVSDVDMLDGGDEGRSARGGVSDDDIPVLGQHLALPDHHRLSEFNIMLAAATPLPAFQKKGVGSQQVTSSLGMWLSNEEDAHALRISCGGTKLPLQWLVHDTRQGM